MDGPFFADTFTDLPDARAIARWLLFDDPTQPFPFARQARLAYLLQQPALVLKGEAADALIAVATVQGTHRQLFPFLLVQFATLAGAAATLDPLDFVMLIDAAAWARRALNPEQGRSGFPIEREALIYHELCHLRQLETSDGEPKYHEDGREMLALRRHTYEFFDTELTRYGPVTTGLEQVGTDFVTGAHAEKARTRPQLRRVK